MPHLMQHWIESWLWFSIKIIFFKKIYLFYSQELHWERGTEREGHRERALPSTDSLPKWSQWLPLGQSNARSHSLLCICFYAVMIARCLCHMLALCSWTSASRTQSQINSYCWWIIHSVVLSYSCRWWAKTWRVFFFMYNLSCFWNGFTYRVNF